MQSALRSPSRNLSYEEAASFTDENAEMPVAVVEIAFHASVTLQISY